MTSLNLRQPKKGSESLTSNNVLPKIFFREWITFKINRFQNFRKDTHFENRKKLHNPCECQSPGVTKILSVDLSLIQVREHVCKYRHFSNYLVQMDLLQKMD